MKPIGLLYDSVSNNTGDRAIGVAVGDILTKKGYDYEVIDPFNFDKNDYSLVVIGGGYLLRESDDKYYDIFRLGGHHVLNAVGTSTSENLDYLKDYLSVAVRSKKDLTRIIKNQPDLEVQVIPCSTIAMDDPKNSTIDTRGFVGIHFVADTLVQCEGFEDIINSIAEKKAVMPFTHYNKDESLMRRANLIGEYVYLGEHDPRTVFGMIGNMKAVIVSSLHATIFAYAHNIPFLSFYQEKVWDFLEDRGLTHLIFRNSKELKDKLPYLDKKKQDFTNLVNEDKEKIDNFFNEFLKDIKPSKKHKVRLPTNNKSSKSIIGEMELRLDLEADVLEHRDALIQELIQRNVKLRSVLNQRDSDLQRLQRDIDWMKNTKTWQARAKLADVKRSLKG